MREAFTFYRSYIEALEDCTPEEQLECLTNVINYALEGKEPEFHSAAAKMHFRLVKPNIDANLRDRANGKKGGRPKKSFTPPTLEEVKAYINENGYSQMNPERFFNYYKANDWKAGNTQITDWKAKVDSWATDKKITKIDERDNDYTEIEQMLINSKL